MAEAGKTPLPTDDNGGRTAGGRFGPGNRLARGNPNNKKAQQLRNAVIRAVSTADIRAIVATAVEQAKLGDPQARA